MWILSNSRCGFSESYAPVVSNVTYRIMLIVEILKGLTSKIVDVETAFLHGRLEEEIYMECPKVLGEEKGKILLLTKSIYGLVQAARQFYKKWTMTLKSIGFKRSLADPCLFKKEGPVYLGTYVDDNYILGKEEDINKVIKDIEDKGLKVKVEDNLTDYLSCNIIFDKDKKKAWIGQPHLLKKMEQKFGERVRKLRDYQTPGTPGKGVTRPKEDSELLSSHEQTQYRSGVGMLLYLVKHTRPDLANATRELSKCMDKADQQAMKELMRVIKFALITKKYGLKIEPKIEELMWKLLMYADADWAGDKDYRLSVSGFILYLCGVPIMWRSRAQRRVTLSSGESEYISLSEAAKEIKFVVMILESMDIKVQFPIVVMIDNIAAIYMAETANASSRTRHVDVRYHFIREFVEDKFIQIQFVTTKKNLADMFTKNIQRDTYVEHVKEMVKEKS